MNEDLRSIGEEIERFCKALQSQNLRLSERIDELESDNRELSNLLASTDGRRLRRVADAMPVLIASCDVEEIYRFCNARSREWFGFNPEQMVGKTVREVVGEVAYRRVRPHIARVLAGERVSFEDRMSYPHGHTRDVRVEYVPDRGPDGVVGYFAMIEDIGTRVTADREHARLAGMVRYSHDAILGKDLDGVITDWNAAAEQVYGYQPAEVIGRHIGLLVPDDKAGELSEILERVRRGEATEHLETTRRRKDGRAIDVLLTVSPIFSAAGDPIGASASAHDISRRLAAERELQKLAERLEEQVAERTATAEKRAVELRAIAAQITHAEQRARQSLAHAIHDDLQQLLVAAMMRIPHDGEAVSRAELDRVGQLLDAALQRCRSLVSELRPPVIRDGSLIDICEWLGRHMREHHELEVDLRHDGLSEALDEDTRTVLFEVLRELLFNVVKHAGSERATVAIDRDAAALRITVSDDGRGFDPSRLEHRSDGFGLLTVHERIHALGGSLETDSAPGRGSRFAIDIPLRQPRTRRTWRTRRLRKSSRPRRSPTDPIRILVVDDHEIVRDGLIGILGKETGFEIIGEAADGAEAIAKALDLEPDVVVMDISMPNINGIEATREIVDRLPQTIVVGLSVHDEDDLGQVICEAGAITYLQKNAASRGLIDAIRSRLTTTEDQS